MTISSVNPLHLYRALLRETTYLFDHNARQWTQGQIKLGFHNHGAKRNNEKRWKGLTYDPYKVPSLNERHRLKRGRKFLVLLQRANRGHQRQLRTLLQLTYGRKGRQKRRFTKPLMQDTLKVDQPTTPAAPAASAVSTASTASQTPAARADNTAVENVSASLPKKFSKDWKPPEDFMSILHTQNQLSSYLSIRKQIRLKSPVTETNKWGRPMPPSRVKNTTEKWYAKLAAVVMPPISEHEWERLKGLSMRRQEFMIRPRRPTARRNSETQTREEAEAAANAIVSGLPKPDGHKMFISVMNPHKLTPRYLSRFYGRHILNHSPVAVSNPAAKGLVSKWDDGKRSILSAAKPMNQVQTQVLFG